MDPICLEESVTKVPQIRAEVHEVTNVEQRFGAVFNCDEKKDWDRAVKTASYAIAFVVSVGKRLTGLPGSLGNGQQRYQWGEVILLRHAQAESFSSS